jgi:predicted transport protein
MSTKFGIPSREIDIELGDENGIFDYISEDFFQDVAFRNNRGKISWIMALADELPDDTKVYALDNSQQGIYTIGDIKKEIETQ